MIQNPSHCNQHRIQEKRFGWSPSCFNLDYKMASCIL